MTGIQTTTAAVAVAAALLLSTTMTTAASSPQQPSEDDNVLSFPLLSGRHILERHLLERKHRHLREDPIQIDALYQGYGTHYVDLWVGTPTPQRQTVIVDTGSSVTAFPCAGCQDCGNQFHTDDYYDPARSETFRKLSCRECHGGSCHKTPSDKKGYCSIHMSYAEGSWWSAYEAEDWLYAGGSHNAGYDVDVDALDGDDRNKAGPDENTVTKFETKFNFGCQSSLTGLFRTQMADGIMGMSNEKNTFWDQMYRAGKIRRKQFALCFSRQNHVDTTGTGAGAMTIGGYDTSIHKSPMVYASQVSSSRSFFTIAVRNIYLRENGGESVVPDNDSQKLQRIDIGEHELNTGGLIVDSGTTDTYFTNRLARPFKAKFKEITGQEYSNNPLQISLFDVRKLPTIVMQIKGVEEYEYGPDVKVGLVGDLDPDHPNDILVAVPATHYMEYDAEKELYTPRIYVTEKSGSVLGANTMQGHDVFFDLENRRIGFAESDCDYTAPDVPGADEQSGAEGSKKISEGTDVEVVSTSSSPQAEQPGSEAEHEDSAHQTGAGGTVPASSTQNWGESTKDGGVDPASSSWGCTTSRCRAFAGLGLVGAVCVALVALRYARHRSGRRGVQAVETVDSFEYDDDGLTFDEEGEEEILRSDSNPIV